ncbi:hypothetical protein V2J09_003688 [Rumex salicifolius]
MHKLRVLFCFFCQALFVIVVQFGQLPRSDAQLSSSESRILLQIQQHLEYPEALKGWSLWTNFCYLPYSSSVIVVCSNSHVSELTIIGNKNSSQTLKKGGAFSVSQQSLSTNFSIDSLFTDVTKLSGLKKLSLVSLGIWGPFPDKISRLSSLEVLNFTSNFIYGGVPASIASLKILKSLVLFSNLINGSVPDLTGLNSLQELDLGSNRIGPEFPSLGANLVYIKLQNNSLRSEIPSQLSKLTHLQWIDVSSNHLVGPVPSSLFSLPALWYLNLAGNQLTGAISKKTTCGGKLWIVDISNNLLSGKLPSCLGSKSSNKNVLTSWNCLSGVKQQHAVSYCQIQAIAVKPPSKKGHKKNDNHSDSTLKLGIMIAVIAAIVVIGGVEEKRVNRGPKEDDKQAGFSKYVYSHHSALCKFKVLNVVLVKLVAEYMPRTLRMPALSLPTFHDFTLEELEEATNGFDPVNIVRDEGSQGQLYKGVLRSGSEVLIKSIKLKGKHSLKSLKQHMEVISQLRHQNLVSVIGHCIVASQERNNKGGTIFVVLEHVPNGSLREHLTDWRRKDRLKWPQRMTISMGIARGIHFLHTGITPRLYGNDLSIERILLDESLTPKVGSYKISLPSKLERSLGESAAVLQQAVDTSLKGTFAYQSLRTAVEITINCLNKDPSMRPPMEDVLWYLQYSIQVQQSWTSSGNLGLNSGNLGMNLH